MNRPKPVNPKAFDGARVWHLRCHGDGVPRHTIRFFGVLCSALAAGIGVAANGVVAGAGDTEQCERTHVRAADLRAEAAIALGMERSPTFRSLVEAIQHSDLIVYVTAQFWMAVPIDGEIHFLTMAGEHRFLHVIVRGELSPWDRCAIVAHELQHAQEIAAAPGVRDTASMDALYHQIGFAVGVDRHETDAARSAATQVMRELSPGWKPEAPR